MPPEMRQYKKHQEFIKQAVCKAGDVVIFSEATTHGTLPWTADYQRRSVLFRYSPANVDFAGGRHAFDQEHRRGNAWPESWYEGLTDAQRAVLEPPYVTGLERPVLGVRRALRPQRCVETAPQLQREVAARAAVQRGRGLHQPRRAV